MSSSPDAVKVPVTSQKGGDPTESKAVAKEGTTSSASLLDTDGDLAPAFHLALARIFLRFSSSAQKLGLKLDSADAPALDVQLNKLKKVAMEDEELDAFARATNGEVLSNESKDEIKEYLDCDDQARITFSGFCEMYHLQTGSDAAETWKDLKALGFNDNLELVKEGKKAQDTKDEN